MNSLALLSRIALASRNRIGAFLAIWSDLISISNHNMVACGVTYDLPPWNVNMKTCTGCGEELDDDLKGPCPDCGATGTTASLLLKNQTLTLNERGICME